jgi:hypothetical protein
VSNVHIFRAKDQPATRYSVTLDMPKGPETMWFVCRRRKLFFCFKCKQRRWAGNLTAHVYYDGIYYFCKKGKGCKVR